MIDGSIEFAKEMEENSSNGDFFFLFEDHVHVIFCEFFFFFGEIIFDN